jgi:hypothetical protein
MCRGWVAHDGENNRKYIGNQYFGGKIYVDNFIVLANYRNQVVVTGDFSGYRCSGC